MTGSVIVSKVANALVEDAQGSPTLGPVVDAVGGQGAAVDWVLDRFRATTAGCGSEVGSR